MTAAEPATGGGDSLQIGYEALRSVAVGGSSAGPWLGLVVLLREGVAAWVARRSRGSDPVEIATPPDRGAGAALIADEVHAGVVRVLASMVLGRRHKEMNP